MTTIRRLLLLMMTAALFHSCKEEEVIPEPVPGDFVIDLSIYDQYDLPCGITAILDAAVEDATYLWDDGETTRTVQLPESVSGLFTVQITTADSSWTDSIGISRTVFTALYIPNSFTPNGDGVNDIFKIYGSCMQQLNIMIFNHSNTTKLYESNDPNIGWDGTFKGQPVSAGEYPYRVYAVFYDGTIRESRGTLLLLR